MKKYCLFSFIFVGILVLGFGVPYMVLAVTPCSLDPGHPDGSTCTVDISYEDPKPEINSGLKACEYQVALKGSATTSGNWQSAGASGACSGKDPVTISVNIDISTNNPGISKSGKYDVYKRATDVANNTSTPLYTGESFLADLEKPLVSADNSSSSWINESVIITLSTSDPGTSDTGGSGWKEARYNWDDNAMNAFCTSGGTTFNNNKKLSANEGPHALYLCARDGAGNTNIWNGEYKVDSEKPEITIFNADPIALSLLDLTTTISYTVSDPTPGSGLNRVELWKKRAEDNWPSFTKEDFKQSVSGNIDSGSFQDTFLPGADGIYNYGIHVIDNVDNRCRESNNPCGNLVSVLTVEVKTLPDAPYNLHASGEGPAVIDLNWTKGDGADRTIIRRKTVDFPISITDGDLAYNGTGISVIDTGAPGYLTEGTTYYYRAWSVKSVEGYGDLQSSSYDEVIESTTVSNVPNSPPSISSVLDAPDPIKADAFITFYVDWSDPNINDSVKLFICKLANGVTGGNCQGGSPNTWCKTSATSISPAQCSYITDSGDAGSNDYYAYVCDGSACSSSFSGSFTVDAIAPVLLSIIPFDRLAWSTSDVVVTVTYSDDRTGVQYTRHCWTAGVSCDPGTTSVSTFSNGGIITQINSGEWILCARASDAAGNWSATECSNTYRIDKDSPNSTIDAPLSGWLNKSIEGRRYYIETTDEDLGSGLDESSCTFEVYSYEDPLDPGTEVLTKQSSRICNLEASHAEELIVGPIYDEDGIVVVPAPYCNQQGRDACSLYIGAKDNLGNTGEGFMSYNIDWEFPETGSLYIEANEGDQSYPIHVFSGASVTYKVRATDTVEISYCRLYIGNTMQDVIMMPQSGSATDRVLAGSAIITDSGNYGSSYAVCYDASSQGTKGSEQTIIADELILEAPESPGTAQTLFDLKATISGDYTEPINYKFDCVADQDDIWDYEQFNVTNNMYTAVDLCTYQTPETYIAKVQIQRGVLIAEETVSIVVSSNASPSAINLQDNNNTADYCFAGAPPIILSWDFDDPGDSQSAYQVQVDINSGFFSPEIDSGKVASSSTNYVPLGLSYGTSYWWRVMVWDMADASSAWTKGSSFTTPVHVYPSTDFSWSPLFPANDEEVQFTDGTVFDAGSTNQSWSWDFGDGTGSSIERNPAYIYADTTSYMVELTATDDVGSCVSSQTIRVSIPLPEWLEISPF